MKDFHLPPYLDFLGPELLDHLAEEGEAVAAVDGLVVAAGLREAFPDIETDEALRFTVELYHEVRDELREILQRRVRDRAFVDAYTAECAERNAGHDFHSPDYETVIGARDDEGRLVVGPLDEESPVEKVVVPDFIAGEQVTLFGPPDTAKLSINAMNALHRRPDGEPPLVTELVEAAGEVPRWGADNEDSKTPIMRDFLLACRNLIGCFDRSLQFVDEERGRTYELADEDLAVPIKRIPGLALPDGSHLVDGNPLPLHLYDFAMHLFHNWQRSEALVFYVPKLENEEEAAYLKTLITRAEERIAELHPEYEPGTVKLFIVFENPRAIFRIREIADALRPHFLGGSLGWHDFLASTARLFKNDPRYRIPVKADPNIVINHIRESHEILVRSLDPIGAITIGGMYGVLHEGGNPASYEVSMVGYIKDVVTQLKRGLDGFWVAHPDFVRPGIALVEAFRRWDADPKDDSLRELVTLLVPNANEHEPLLEFVFGDDVPGLPEDDSAYLRGVLAADLETSDVIANDDPEEVRYNVFQALQYLADWLRGNGCVALPATMTNASGEEVFVRVMDDLATTERSRWELWAEVAHGRVPVETFEQILAEEVAFIRGESDDPTRRVQVAWEGEAAKWYPVAIKLLRQLVTDPDPPEFATELLLPFTFDNIREASDPWAEAQALNPGKYND
jgi:malate synthase